MSRRPFFAVAIVAASIFAGSAQATTYYVSPSGSDSSAGTSSAAPWRTVSRVNGASLAPGDAVLFEGGQTFADSGLMPPTSGTTIAPIRFGSYGTARSKLVHGATVWLGAGRHDLVFENLDLSAGNLASGIFTSTGSGTGVYNIVLRNSYLHDTAAEGVDSPQHGDHNWVIENNTISHTGDSGLILWGANDVVRHNTIADTGWNTGLSYGKHGIYAKGADMTIAGNDFFQNHDGQAVSLRMHGARVYSNTIHDTCCAVAIFDYDLAPPPQGTNYVYNNRMWNISGWGFYTDGGRYDPNTGASLGTLAIDLVWASNTFIGTGSEAINLSAVPSTAHVWMVNNVFAGSYGSAYRGCATCTEHHNDWFGASTNLPSGPGDLRLNPALSAPSALAPSATSPGIDRGSLNLRGLTYMPLCDGEPLHYCGSAPDLGAAEFLPVRLKAARGATYSVTKQLRAHLQTGRYRLRRP